MKSEIASAEPTIRQCGSEELPQLNRILSEAVNTWALADRVVRLSTPMLAYKQHDFDIMTFAAAYEDNGNAIGFTGWNTPASTTGSVATDEHALVLHALYVLPEFQSRGVGQRLLRHASEFAASISLSRLELKAWRNAEPYFRRLGFHDLVTTAKEKLYPLPMYQILRPSLLAVDHGG